MKKISGFTMIELMIVVGIISLLAALAIPNFIRYQAKSKQTEARLSLAAIFTGNKAFFSSYSTYTSDLDHIGWTPEGKTYYRAGFASLFPAGSIPGIATFTGPVEAVGTIQSGSECAAVTGTVLTESFSAHACGTIRAGIPADEWTMDQDKVITNTISGI